MKCRKLVSIQFIPYSNSVIRDYCERPVGHVGSCLPIEIDEERFAIEYAAMLEIELGGE